MQERVKGTSEKAESAAGKQERNGSRKTGYEKKKALE